MKKTFLFSTLFFLALSISQASSKNDAQSSITIKEIDNTLKNWCSSLVDVSTAYNKKGLSEATKKASEMIDNQYIFDNGGILFKPTLSENPNTFRSTKEGTLSYFVGGNKNFPKDKKGFALKNWVSCEPTNYLIKNIDSATLVMGKVAFKNQKGEETVVDKTWGFKKDNKGNVKIFLHHSSLEYSN